MIMSDPSLIISGPDISVSDPDMTIQFNVIWVPGGSHGPSGLIWTTKLAKTQKLSRTSLVGACATGLASQSV